jgi:hypothetical protein
MQTYTIFKGKSNFYEVFWYLYCFLRGYYAIYISFFDFKPIF